MPFIQPNISNLNHNTHPDTKKYRNRQETAERKNGLEDNHDKIIQTAERKNSLEDNHDKITQDPPGHHPQDATKDLCHRNLQDKQHLTNTEAEDLHQGHDADQGDSKARLFEDKNKIVWFERIFKTAQSFYLYFGDGPKFYIYYKPSMLNELIFFINQLNKEKK
jgi:hypothetical protein